MKIVNNRRSLMAIAALWIIVFHLWINVIQGNQVEAYLKSIAYIGVDMFFFLSAYSLSSRKITDLKSYYISRFKAVYVKFAVFAVIAAFMGKWSIGQLLKTLCGINLVQKGGGAFLWFLPAITIFYILFPLFQRFAESKPTLAPIAVLIGWFVIGFAVTEFTEYNAMFIFWNRIPSLVLGYLAKQLEKGNSTKLAGAGNDAGEKAGKEGASAKGGFRLSAGVRLAAGIVLLVIGGLLLMKWGFKYKLNAPIYNIFYIVALPAMLGCIMVFDFIPEWRIVKAIGSATLEIYAIQMVFGYKWAGAIYNMTRNALVTNLATIVIVFGVAIAANKVFSIIFDLLKKKA